jgi:DNA-binding response OmpR family regulator
MKLLLVDDDAVLTRAYRDRLSAHGFQVNTAANAAAALSFFKSAKPDLVVLDLMLPDLSGVELLKFIRSEPKFVGTPVVLLTNTYRNSFGREAAALGIEKAFLKAECSPSVLMAAIDEILQPELAAARPPESEAEPEPPAPPAEPAPVAPHADAAQVATEEPRGEAGAGLLADAPAICAVLGQLFETLAREPQTGPEQQDRLQDLFFRVHSLAVAAGQTEFALLAQTTALFDALLCVLMQNPERLGPSVLGTVKSLVEVVPLLFQHARETGGGGPLQARVLVVDDDPLANQTVVAALGPAQVDACSTEDSLAAWQWLNCEHFDLVVMDIEMPVFNGLKLCQRLRTVSGYEKTPLIFVTAHDDPDTRLRSTLSGADDLMAKPFLPQELAAKVVLHLIRAQMQV